MRRIPNTEVPLYNAHRAPLSNAALSHPWQMPLAEKAQEIIAFGAQVLKFFSSESHLQRDEIEVSCYSIRGLAI